MAAGVLDRGTAATDWQSRVDDFNARYGRALDDGRLADWMAFFTDDAVYKVIAREAYDLGQPMGVMSCEGRGMFVDRVVATEKTLIFASRYLCHIIGRALIGSASADRLTAEASYLVLQTQVEKATEILQCGRYVDEFVVSDGALKLAKRFCVYDTTIIPNALIYPI